MKFAFVTGSVSRNGGGVFESIRALARAIQSRGHVIAIYGVEDDNTQRDIDSWHPVKVNAFPFFGPQRLSYAPRLSEALKEQKCDIIHSHSLWNHTSIAVRRWNRRTGKPYVVHPHGMLDPWALRNSHIAKSLIKLLYESGHLRNSACIRALNESEARSIRAYNLKNPICIIPNGIDLPQVIDDQGFADDSCMHAIKKAGYKVLLYLGRVHPKKGLINLLHAWKAVLNSRYAKRDSWIVAIAGWDEKSHEAELKSLAQELQMPWTDMKDNQRTQPTNPVSVVFLGPQFGAAKAACFKYSDAFILPSFSEGLPMTVLEAWSYGKPVLITPECNLPEGFAAGAAIRVQTNVETLELGLRQLFEMSDRQRQMVGAFGLKLVTERFTWPKIAGEICSVSDWVLGGGQRPECVQLA